MDPRLLFFTGCIPSRLLLTYLAYLSLNDNKSNIPNIPNILRILLICITLSIGIGLWAIYLKGWRKTGIETGGKKIWWNSIRPIHGTIYLLFSFFAILGYKYAWILLLIDVFVGIFMEIKHKY